MNYLLEFKPLDRYFFGGEITFGENRNDDKNKDADKAKKQKQAKVKANYFAKSNLIPQSSTILGTLRYEILRQKGLLDYKPENNSSIRQHIGSHSFSIEKALEAEKALKYENDGNICSKQLIKYGIILAISPLFIADSEGNYYTAMPLDSGITVSTRLDNDCYYSGRIRKEQMQLDNFDPKTYDNFKYWVNKDKKKLTDVLKERFEKKDELQSIYTISEQIGILKENNDKDKEGFFKQQLITLHPDLSFVCTAEINGELNEGNSFIYMGANRSIFILSIRKNKNNIDFTCRNNENYFHELQNNNRTLLLSDAYITDELRDKARFIWGESVNFRSIDSSVDAGVSWAKPVKSNLYHLLPRGSVIYGDNIAEYLTIRNLQTVGMNIFL